MNIIHSILIVIETVILTLSSAIAEVPVQKEVTLKEASKACTLNDGKNCNRLGNLFYKGEGVEKSNLKAVEFFSKACGFNSPSGCGSLAERFYNGEGIEKSYPKAFEYYTKAC